MREALGPPALTARTPLRQERFPGYFVLDFVDSEDRGRTQR